MKTCPFCANEIQDAAIKCQFCHSMIEPAATPKPEPTAAPDLVPDSPPAPIVAAAAGMGSPGAAAQEPSRPAKPRAARQPRHPILQILIIVGIIYFVAVAGFDLFKGRFFGVAANLVGAIPFALSAPLMWWLGDAFRNFAMPSWYFGSGAIDMAKQRLFWMFGPQTVGVLISFALFAGFGAIAGEIPMPFAQQQTAESPPSDASDSGASASAAQAEADSGAPLPPAAAVASDPQGRFSPDGQSAGTIADLPPTETLLFEGHKVEVYTGPPTSPDFSDMDRALAGYIPKLKAAVAAGPNFAGSYAISTFSCGVGCLAGVAIDLANGDSISLPRGGPQEPHLALEFVKDSSFIRMRWAAQTDSSGRVTSCGHEDYVLTDNGFESQGKGVEPGPCPQ